MNTPKIAVCIPCYNSEKTIGETIESIQKQTYNNINIHVIDNASTDNTINILKEYQSKDKRMKLHLFKENIGGEGNFTRCIEIADGEYTTIFHADDKYEKTILEKEYMYFVKHPETGAVFTSALLIDENSNIIGRQGIWPSYLHADKKPVEFKELFLNILKYGNFLMFPSAMVRSSIYKNEIIKWDINQSKTSSDLDVWLRIATNHPIGYIDEPLLSYRSTNASYSYRIKNTRTVIADMFLVLDRYFDKLNKMNCLSEQDIIAYNFLRNSDLIICSRNFLIKGEKKKALELILKIIKNENFNGIQLLRIINFIIKSRFMLLCCIVPCGTFILKIELKIKEYISKSFFKTLLSDWDRLMQYLKMRI